MVTIGWSREYLADILVYEKKLRLPLKRANKIYKRLLHNIHSQLQSIPDP